MRQKHLESALSSARREFPNPDVTLEQYPTSPQLTAAVIRTALDRHDVGPGRSVLDLGCGTGMLSLGCALVESDFVWGVDCDADALQVAADNVEELELDDRVSLIQAQVSISNVVANELPAGRKSHATRGGRGRKGGSTSVGRVHSAGRGRGASGRRQTTRGLQQQSGDSTALEKENDDNALFPLTDKCVDTVVTNPPFGTKPDKAGIDVDFLKLACRLARRAVYSFHKTSTREYILRTTQALPNVENVTVIAKMKFDLPRTYKFHQQASVDIEVDLICVEILATGNDMMSPDEIN